MKKRFLIAASLMFSSLVSFGGGFQLNLQGLRQLAMGGSGTAVPWDAATIFYNPAGLSCFDHWQAYASVLFVMPKTRYVQSPTGTYATDAESQTFTPFNVYVGGPAAYKSPLSIGIGIYTPFGNGIKWDDNWVGRYMIQDISLRTIFVQPTASYMINDVISVGAGLIYANGHVEMRRALAITDPNNNDGRAELIGDGHGFGFNLGIQVNASEKLRLGLNYRSKVNMKVRRGFATFTVPSSLQSSFPYTPFSAEIPLPEVASLGVGYKATEDLTLQADLNLVGWNVFKSLDINFENNTAALGDSHSPRNYKNTIAIRVGGHYNVTDRFAAMAGAAYDPSPVRDGFVSPDLPDANRGVFTVGATYTFFERLTVMGVMEFVSSAKRDASYDDAGFTGRYQTKAFTPGIGISYDF